MTTTEYTTSTAPAPDDKVRIVARHAKTGRESTVSGTIVCLDDTDLYLATKTGPLWLRAANIVDVRRVK